MAIIIRLIEAWDKMFKEAVAAGAVKVGNE